MDVESSIIEQIERQEQAPSDRAQDLARDLINVPRAPERWADSVRRGAESAAYYENQPYPWWHFGDWDTQQRGPFPRCMPIVRTGIDKAARWLFGKPVEIQCPKNKTLEEWLRRMWVANRMQTRMVPVAARGGIQGGCALKFSWDPKSDPPLCIQTLGTTQYRCYYDPFDRERLLMVRIQFEYQDPLSGSYFFAREEWTAEEQVTYVPTAAKWVTGGFRGRVKFPDYLVVADGGTDPDAYRGWQIEDRGPNPFGLIPVTPIRNIDDDDPIGKGDYWELLRVIDRINLTYHLMDRSNQFDSEPLLMFLDLAIDKQDLVRPLMPGQPLDLKSDDDQAGEAKKGSVVQMEARGSLRPAMMEYANKLERYVAEAASTVAFDPEDITNKGQMSQAVMALVFAPLIESTHQKRRTYGEDGIGKFMESAAKGLRNAGASLPELGGVNPDDHDTFSVQLVWPKMLPMSEEEKLSAIQRWDLEINGATMTHERIIERVAEMEGVEDLDKLKEELKPLAEARAAGVEQMVGPQETEPPDAKDDRTHARAAQGFEKGLLKRDEARQMIGKPPVGK